MNPWLLEEGASGSSAGPGAATAAGLVGFSIGSETGGSIIAPAMRCGDHRAPSYLRSRPAHGCDDAVLDARQARSDDADDRGLDARARGDHRPRSRRRRERAEPPRLRRDRLDERLRVGYFPAWMKENPATDVDRAALEALKKLGMTTTDVRLPDWPYSSLMPVLFSEAAAAFEEITLSGADDTLKVQVPDAWPNLFRQSRFLSAVDFVQADRFRRRVALEMARIFSEVDVLLVPSLRDEMLTISNFTGHPSLTLRAGFVNVSEARSDWAPDPNNPLPKFSPARRVPHGVTLIGRLFDEGTIARAGLALERALGVVEERPAGSRKRLSRGPNRGCPRTPPPVLAPQGLTQDTVFRPEARRAAVRGQDPLGRSDRVNSRSRPPHRTMPETIGVISDTHGLVRPEAIAALEGCSGHPCRRRRLSGRPRTASPPRAGRRRARQRRQRPLGEIAAMGRQSSSSMVTPSTSSTSSPISISKRDPWRQRGGLRTLSSAIDRGSGWRALPRSRQRRPAAVQISGQRCADVGRGWTADRAADPAISGDDEGAA